MSLKGEKKYRYSTPNSINRFFTCTEEIFSKHIYHCGLTNIKELFDALTSDQKEKILKVSFFYYYRGWKLMQKSEWHKEIDEGLIFIILISIVEAVMPKIEYQDPIIWYSINQNNYKKPSDAINAYNERFGIKRTFKKFINTYLLIGDKNKLIDSIRIWEDKAFVPLESTNEDIKIDAIANLMYDLRSSFVHDANYIPFVTHADSSVAGYKGSIYIFNIKFPEIVEIFEAGILNYFNLNH